MNPAELFQHVKNSYPCISRDECALPISLAGANMELRFMLSPTSNEQIDFHFFVLDTQHPRRSLSLTSEGAYFERTGESVIPLSDLTMDEPVFQPESCYRTARLIETISFTLLQHIPSEVENCPSKLQKGP